MISINGFYPVSIKPETGRDLNTAILFQHEDGKIDFVFGSAKYDGGCYLEIDGTVIDTPSYWRYAFCNDSEEETHG